MSDEQLDKLMEKEAREGSVFLYITANEYKKTRNPEVLFRAIEMLKETNDDLSKKLTEALQIASVPSLPKHLFRNILTTRAGEMTDGSHTMDELYYHRMILFATITQTYKEHAWKSWYHDDGTMFPNFFIVGIKTPEGDFTYHYRRDHWESFDVKEVEKAPPFDGHTSADVTRLLGLHNTITGNKKGE